MTADLYACYHDVDGNGAMNVLDALLVVNYILEIETLTPEQRDIADVSGDGDINVIDVQGIVKAILGSCPEESATYPDGATVTFMNFGDRYEVWLENSMNVSGVQLHISCTSPFGSVQKTARSSSLDSASHDMSDSVKVVLYGPNGEAIAPDPDNGSILNLFFSGGGNPNLTKVVLSTPDAEDIPVTINHECGSLGLVKGSVKDGSSQGPISNALVKLYISDGSYAGHSDYSDGNGYFEMGSVDPGDYYLMVTKTGYTNKRDPSSGSFTVDCAETESRGTIYLNCSPGKVKGYVEDSQTGSGIYNALAKLYTSGGSYTGKYDYTSSSGYFQINSVSSGNYYLRVSKSDYDTEREPSSGSFNVACGETENRGTIYLDPSCQVPATPTGLAGSTSNGHPHISWNSVDGATSYRVYKSLNDGPYDFLASTTTTSYTDEGFNTGSGLDVAKYKVSAKNSCGESAM
ncbi:MAG: carboxypeptidase regulatory-like domain-containing protein, partial [bacterium]